MKLLPWSVCITYGTPKVVINEVKAFSTGLVSIKLKIFKWLLNH